MTSDLVLQVIASTERRGAETFALDLDRALRARGHRVHTVALAPGQTPGLDVPTLGPRALAPSTLRALRAAARTASIVVAHGSTTLPACGIALVGTRVPFVYRNIGDPTYWTRSPTRRLRVGMLLRRAAAVVAVADDAAATIVERFRVPAARVTTIPTAVSAKGCSPPDPRERRRARAAFGLPDEFAVAAVVGALSVEKDVSTAIEVAGLVPDLHLLVVGDGPERARLERLAAVQAPNRVHFTGSLADPGPAYAAADLVLLTSRTEGLPAVLIEAGMRGLPVVARRVGYVAEVVDDDTTGLLVTQSEPSAFVAPIRDALRRAPELGRAARDRCLGRFAMEPVARAWSTLLSARGRRSTRPSRR
jgi:glycosyltransferase involved in cell wall biosynthesis